MRKSWFAVVLLSLPLLTVACKGKKKALPPPVGAAPAAPTGAAPGAAGAPGAASVPAEPQPTPLAGGTMAPDFLLPAHDGTKVSLSGLRGGPVVLYFYPKDDTPGCTIEAQAFRDQLPAYDQSGAAILGVSLDDAESHRAFVAKYNLPFKLLVDPEATLAKAYGVPLKNGHTSRVTFVIDREGRIARTFPKVDPRGHDAEVLAVVTALPK